MSIGAVIIFIFITPFFSESFQNVRVQTRHGPIKRILQRERIFQPELYQQCVQEWFTFGNISEVPETKEVRDQTDGIQSPPTSELNPGGLKPQGSFSVSRSQLCCCPTHRPPLPPEFVSSKDVCLLVFAPVKGGIHSLDIRGQSQAGQWLGVPSLQGAG